MEIPVITDSQVRVVNVCDLIDIFCDAGVHGYKDQSEAVIQWCRNSGAHYYGRPKETFFVDEAIEEARCQGKSVVVVEDLS